MSTTRNGGVEIYYEAFGEPDRPTLLLVNGLGSQCINYAEEWCSMFVDTGYRVVRFDNRDVGLSSKLEGQEYTLGHMAEDALAVLDACEVRTAHVMGCSMGGMIVQRLAIDHPDRLLSVTSVMSRTGERGYGDSSEAALSFLMAPPASSRAEYIDRQVAALQVYGSKPEWLDEDLIRARAGSAFDRCFWPSGPARQMRGRCRWVPGRRAPCSRPSDIGDAREPGYPHRPERRTPDCRAGPRRPLCRDRRNGPRLSPSRVGEVGHYLVGLRP